MIERLRQLPRGLIAVLALSLTLNSIGAGWALPDDRAWSNDDPTPKVPLRIGQIWCCGDNKSPYLQPMITLAVYAPSVAWCRHNGDIVEPCDDLGDADCFRRPYDQLGWLMAFNEDVFDTGQLAGVPAMLKTISTACHNANLSLDSPREAWVDVLTGLRNTQSADAVPPATK